MTITELCQASHQMAKNKGWYVDNRSPGELIALMHSELSEALEEYRAGRMDTWYSRPDLDSYNTKPEGFGIELADCVIRICDACTVLGIDLEDCIRLKMEYNSTREYRHGGKKI